MLAMTARRAAGAGRRRRARSTGSCDLGHDHRAWPTHPPRCKQIAIEPTERRAAIAGDDPDVILVDLATGAVERRRGHTDARCTRPLFGRPRRAPGHAQRRQHHPGLGSRHRRQPGAARPRRRRLRRGGDRRRPHPADRQPRRQRRLWRRRRHRKTVVVGQLGDVRAMRPLGGDEVRVVIASDPIRITDVDLRLRTSEDAATSAESNARRGRHLGRTARSVKVVPQRASASAVVWPRRRDPRPSRRAPRTRGADGATVRRRPARRWRSEPGGAACRSGTIAGA